MLEGKTQMMFEALKLWYAPYISHTSDTQSRCSGAKEDQRVLTSISPEVIDVDDGPEPKLSSESGFSIAILRPYLLLGSNTRGYGMELAPGQNGMANRRQAWWARALKYPKAPAKQGMARFAPVVRSVRCRHGSQSSGTFLWRISAGIRTYLRHTEHRN